MRQSLLTLDRTITQTIYHILPHTPFFDAVFSFLSQVGSYGIVWILILIPLIIVEERRNKQFVISFFVSLTTAYVVVVLLLKSFFGRIRPVTNHILTICPTDFSFPSGHAALAFAAAAVLSYYDKKRSAWYFALASFISFSRIYLGCHFFFDVLIGALLGYAIARATIYLITQTK